MHPFNQKNNLITMKSDISKDEIYSTKYPTPSYRQIVQKTIFFRGFVNIILITQKFDQYKHKAVKHIKHFHLIKLLLSNILRRN